MARQYTTKEAANVLDCDPSWVRVLCRKGLLGRKRGRDWVILDSDLKQYIKNRPPHRGPKRHR